jgi:hypothetical protein
MTITHKQSAQTVEDTITEIGVNKTTDKKISDACKRNNVDEDRIRVIAGFDKDGMNEYKIVR